MQIDNTHPQGEGGGVKAVWNYFYLEIHHHRIGCPFAFPSQGVGYLKEGTYQN